MMNCFKKLLLLFLLFQGAVFAQQKPNILWVTIEDTSPQFIGCYGNKDASTPVIDKLAQEGVRFTNAFSTGTVCSPSRTCIITGVKTYKAGTGNHRSSIPIPDYIKGFPYYMQQQGYYTSNNSKTDYNVADGQAFINEAWDMSSNQAGWWDRKPGQPFFAVFNFMSSHQSRTMTNPYDWYEKEVYSKLNKDEQIDDNAFEMPPFYRDSPEMRKQFARVYNSLKLTDNEIGALLNRLENDHLRDSTIIFFYADHGEGMPRGKTNGINMGYRVPFIIWFPEMYKHLSPWGTEGIVTDELVNFEDLAPTVIALAKGEIPKHLNGRILMSEQRSKTTDHMVLSSDRSDNGIDMVRSVTDGKYVYSRNFMPFIPQARYINYMEKGEIKQHMRDDLANDRLNPLQKSLFEDRPSEFLFDIENDIWEENNLALDPKYASLLKIMRKRLKTEVEDSRDVLFLPEYEISLISKTTTPYEFRLDENKYPIKKIYAAAQLSGKRGAEIAKEQVALLGSTNKIVRYWAIMGLRSQYADILKPFEAEIINTMEDDYPPVAIIGSVIAHQAYGSEKAIEKIKTYCTDSNPDLALMTIYNLIYVDNKKPFIETIKTTEQKSAKNYSVESACKDFLRSLKYNAGS